MGKLFQDVRYGCRMLGRQWIFTAVVVIILAVGIGTNGIIFSMVKAVLLRPLPGVQEPEKLISLATTLPSGRSVSTSYPDYVDYRDRNSVFSNLIASSPLPLSLRGDGKPERIWGEIVSGNYFEALGVRSALGRTLDTNDDRAPGAHPVCVISYGLWQRHFGADPDIIGKPLFLNGHPFTVVGVAQKAFAGSVVGLSLSVFVPMMMQGQVLAYPDSFTRRNLQWVQVKGELKPDVTLQQARAAMKVLAGQIAQEYTELNQGQSVMLFPMWQSPFGAQRQLLPILALLMIVAGLVLLIICANVANLQLARATARRKEIAIRLSLGAGRLRLIRQLLTESVLLSLLGGGVGLLLIAFLTNLMTGAKLPVGLPVAFDFTVDQNILGFTFGLSLLTGLVFGLFPALKASKPNIVTELKNETSTRSLRGGSMRNMLVISQVSISLMLLILAGLSIRSLRAEQSIDPGFNAENVILLTLDLKPNGYDEKKGQTFYRQLMDRLTSLPDVESASMAQRVPLGLVGGESNEVTVAGYEPQPKEDMSIDCNTVGLTYFETLGIPLVRGRSFTLQDDEKAPGTVIVNESMAARFWPGQEAVGKRVQVKNRWRQVIGVSRDSKYREIAERSQPHFYLPFLQNYQPEMTLHVRARGNPNAVLSSVENEVGRMDKDLPLLDPQTLSEHVSNAISVSALVAQLMGGMGLAALVLASVGIYGLVAFSVTQRRQEIGIRLALGAQRIDVLRLVMRDGFLLAVTGVVIGLGLAFAAARVMSSLLHGVSPADPLTFGGVTLLLIGAVLLASYLPARRATKLDPMVVLRYQ